MALFEKKAQIQKREHLNIRQPATEDHPKPPTKNIRSEMGQQLRMDSTIYEQQYPHMRMAKVNDLDGEVQKWLDAGAEPVPAEVKHRRIFEGINDRQETKWVTWIGGTDDSGQSFLVYLLMMDPDLYDSFKLAPLRRRQEEIQKALQRGVNQSGMSTGGEGEVAGTYAPKLDSLGVSGEGFAEFNKITE